MKSKDFIVPGLAILCIILLTHTGPVSQDVNYHDFADKRAIFAIPNFWNVVTNLLFVLVGLWGVLVCTKSYDKKLRLIGLTIFAGFGILTLGSGYYHLSPNNMTIVLDRVSMAIIFMSFFAFIVYDRINKSVGFCAFILLNLIGVGTVIYWIVTEQSGKGDLRWYAVIQFFPLIAIPLLMVLYKSPVNYGRQIVYIFILFGLAKLFESFDEQIFEALQKKLSGHSLKHIFMAVAGFEIGLIFHYRFKISR